MAAEVMPLPLPREDEEEEDDEDDDDDCSHDEEVKIGNLFRDSLLALAEQHATWLGLYRVGFSKRTSS